jgi:hypothetical protein
VQRVASSDCATDRVETQAESMMWRCCSTHVHSQPLTFRGRQLTRLALHGQRQRINRPNAAVAVLVFRQDPLPVRTESRGQDPTNMTAPHGQLLAGVHVPQTSGVFLAAGNDLAAVRAESQIPKTCLASLDDFVLFSAGNIPNAERAVIGNRAKEPAIRAEGNCFGPRDPPSRSIERFPLAPLAPDLASAISHRQSSAKDSVPR